MQVKKFEAKTMKEALELVKVHMGPEAIILSAKDSHRGFGLMGERSVEVTAAVSEETLRKKKIAESRLREDLRERFQQIPASKQKEYINKAFDRATDRESARREMVMAGQQAQVKVSAESRAQVSGMRYIDIPDEEQSAENGRERVRRAAEAARNGMAVFQEPKRGPQREPQGRNSAAKPLVYSQSKAQQLQVQSNYNRAPITQDSVARATEAAIGFVTPGTAEMAPRHPEVIALQNQVRELKSLVEKFQQMPQIPMTMHPGAEQGLPFELSPMYQRMTSQGVNPQLVTAMLKRASKELDHDNIRKLAMVDAWMVRQIMNSVEVSATPFLGRYHVFLGCTGQGKTTTLVKFASHLLLKEKKTIAIISLDTIKVGAADQLRIYAQILNVPFAIVRNAEEWKVAQQKLGHINHILVDCPGFNLRTMEEVEWLKSILPPAEMGRQLHYVQSVLARDEETFDIASRYQMIGFHDVIFTRLDESSRQGLLLNFQEKFKVPIHSFGLGNRIPEDYEFATKERVVDFLFKLTKVSKKEESHV
jgi:flagellar biosynthesis protein FlhF